MLVRPRTGALTQAFSLMELASGKNDDELRELLEFEISFGRRSSKDGTGSVELSTLPWRQGMKNPGAASFASLNSRPFSRRTSWIASILFP